MATTTLTEIALEESTYVVTVDFVDQEGTAVTPNAASWTLTDGEGTIINGREDEAIETPSSTETIVLSGADLALQNDQNREFRVLQIRATYDSMSLTDLPLNGSASFYVNKLEAP